MGKNFIGSLSSYRDRIAISLKARRFLLFSLPIDQTQIQSKVDRERRDRLRSKALTICSEKCGLDVSDIEILTDFIS